MKKLARIVFSVALAAGVGCKKDETGGGPKKETPKPVAADPNKAKPADPKPVAKAPTGDDLAKRYQDCWGFFNARDDAKFQTCYAPNIVSDFVDSGMPPVTTWKDIQEKHDKPILDAMPDAKGEVELTLVNGMNGATVALFTGTHTGTLKTPGGDIPATNKKIGLQVAHAVHFADDGMAVDKEWYYQDLGTLLAQLGVSPAPARPAMDKAWPAETIVAKNDDTEKRNLDSSSKLLDTINKHDAKAMGEMFADGLVWSEIGIPMDWNKAQAIAAHDMFFKGFSDLTITPSAMWAAGDYVVLQGVFAGTNDGDMTPAMPIKKTGKKVSITFLQLYKFDKDGKLVASWGFWNSAAFAMQLGLAPPPK